MEKGIIILAAGASTRMGTPKQLLKIGGETLIERTIKIANATNLDNLVIVLGAFKKEIQSVMKIVDVEIAINPNWQEGMGGSVKVGLEKLLALNPKLEQVLILLCDQPFISKGLLMDFFKKQEKTNTKIIASKYENTIGVPALFNQSVFSDLLNLKGKEGAKKVIFKYKKTLETIDFPKGKYDMDTVEDYRKILEMLEKKNY